MGSGSMMTTEAFLRIRERVGDSRVLVERIHRQWKVLGSWVARSPPDSRDSLCSRWASWGQLQ